MTLTTPLLAMTASDASQESSVPERLARIETALDALLVKFVTPTLKQALENQQALSVLIESNQRHTDWLDSDREDINTLREDSTSQIQGLLDSANADRQVFIQRFEQQQTEIRQTQRQLLDQQHRNETLLTEVLSLSRRVTTLEDAA